MFQRDCFTVAPILAAFMFLQDRFAVPLVDPWQQNWSEHNYGWDGCWDGSWDDSYGWDGWGDYSSWGGTGSCPSVPQSWPPRARGYKPVPIGRNKTRQPRPPSTPPPEKLLKKAQEDAAGHDDDDDDVQLQEQPPAQVQLVVIDDEEDADTTTKSELQQEQEQEQEQELGTDASQNDGAGLEPEAAGQEWRSQNEAAGQGSQMEQNEQKQNQPEENKTEGEDDEEVPKQKKREKKHKKHNKEDDVEEVPKQKTGGMVSEAEAVRRIDFSGGQTIAGARPKSAGFPSQATVTMPDSPVSEPAAAETSAAFAVPPAVQVLAGSAEATETPAALPAPLWAANTQSPVQAVPQAVTQAIPQLAASTPPWAAAPAPAQSQWSQVPAFQQSEWSQAQTPMPMQMQAETAASPAVASSSSSAAAMATPFDAAAAAPAPVQAPMQHSAEASLPPPGAASQHWRHPAECGEVVTSITASDLRLLANVRAVRAPDGTLQFMVPIDVAMMRSTV